MASSLQQMAATITERSKTLINNDLKKILKEEGTSQTGNKAALFISGVEVGKAAANSMIDLLRNGTALPPQSIANTEIVDASNVFAKCGLTALGLGIVASMLLMLDLVLPRWAATTLGIALGVLLLMLWAVSPVLRRREMHRL